MRINPSFIKEMTLPETTNKLEHLFADNKVFFAWLVNPVNIESIETYTISTVNLAITQYTFYTVPAGSVVDIVSLALIQSNAHAIDHIDLYKADGSYLPVWFPADPGGGGAVDKVAIPAINLRGLEEGDSIKADVGGGVGETTTLYIGIRDTLKSEY